MRALRFHSHGKPADVLQVDDIEAPEPSAGEVRVRLTHRPIHPSDLSAVAGTYGSLRDLPAVGGNEGVGVIKALGAGVERLDVGMRVIKLGDAPTWQEEVVLHADDVLPVPDALDDATAAQLFVNPLTAQLLLDAVPHLTSGDALVLTAGASAVSRVAVRLAAERRIRSVTIVRSGEHADALRALGAAVVVADSDTPETREALQKAVGEGGAGAVFDAVAGEAGALALSSLGDGGTHVVYGALSRSPLAISPAALIYRRVTVRGVWRTRWFREAPRSVSRPMLTKLADEAARGVFTLPVEATFDLGEIAEAVCAAMASGRLGKVLLTG